MPKLRSRMRVLMAEKGLRENRKITLGIVAEETNLSRPTVTKMAQNEVAQIKGDIIAILCEYFDCNVGDLLYVER
jgi:putative transcriptional regulator